MYITVTKQDIKKGIPACDDACPIARALNRQCNWKDGWGDDTFWYVQEDSINSDSSFFTTPRSVKRFITRFDAGKKVKPFRFRMPRNMVPSDKTR